MRKRLSINVTRLTKMTWKFHLKFLHKKFCRLKRDLFNVGLFLFRDCSERFDSPFASSKKKRRNFCNANCFGIKVFKQTQVLLQCELKDVCIIDIYWGTLYTFCTRAKSNVWINMNLILVWVTENIYYLPSLQYKSGLKGLLQCIHRERHNFVTFHEIHLYRPHSDCAFRISH